MPKRVRLAVVGGRRGAAYDLSMQAFQERVELTAICDLSESVQANWRKTHPGIRVFSSFQDLLASDVCDAVALATPMPAHCSQAIQALEAGKHVMSEIAAATTMEGCYALVETVRKTGLVYMMAENYCYARTTMMVLNLVQKGVFGEPTYAEGGYIHDTRDLSLTPDGQITWRGELRRFNGNNYPTHSMGPVAQWFDAVHGGCDRLVSVATFVTTPKALRMYVKDRLGSNHPNARDDLWIGPDSATTIVQTAKNGLIVMRRDGASPRPHNMVHFELQGTRGAFLSGRHAKEDPLIWIDGVSPGHSPGEADWEVLWTYSDRYEHPRWRQWGEQASKAGHGGGDFFILDDFLRAIQDGAKPGVDVYDAATWSAIMPLSIESVAQGSIPIPDFAKGA